MFIHCPLVVTARNYSYISFFFFEGCYRKCTYPFLPNLTLLSLLLLTVAARGQKTSRL